MARAGSRQYPLSLHGVGLSIGSTDPIDRPHLARIASWSGSSSPCSFPNTCPWNRQRSLQQ